MGYSNNCPAYMKYMLGMSLLYGRKFNKSHSPRVITGAGTNFSCPTLTVLFFILDTFAGMLYAWKPMKESTVVAAALNPPVQLMPVEPLVKSTVRESPFEKLTMPEPVGYDHATVSVADVALMARVAVDARVALPTVVVVTVCSLSKYRSKR